MVRFSCFPTHMHCHKPKKVVQHCVQENCSQKIHKDSSEIPSVGSANKDVQHCVQENCSQEIHKDSSEISSVGSANVIPLSTPSVLKDNSILLSTNTEQITSTSSFECCWKSEELNAISYSRVENEILQSMSIKKSHSLGSALDREGRFPQDEKTDDEIDQGLPLDELKNKRFGGMVSSFDNSGTTEVCGCDDLGTDLLNENQENMFEISTGPVFKQSIFSIEDIKQLDNDFYEYRGQDLSSDDVVELHHAHASHTFSKSSSLPKLGVYESSLACWMLGHQSRSVGNLHDAEVKTGLFNGQGRCNSRESIHKYNQVFPCHDMSPTSDVIEQILHSETDFGAQCVAFGRSKEHKELADKEKDLMTEKEYMDCASKFNDENTPHNFVTSTNDWREPERGSIGDGNIQEEESVTEPWNKLDSEDFNMKRIEEWICQIDIDNSIVEEVGESSSTPNVEKDSHVTNGVNASKPNVKGGGGVKAAYNYISLLTSASTTAQMANLGLVVIPFLSAFSGLRVLNLSGNAIVRITSGALPRGLHLLNLSRNNISVIEGLRELTHLRVLDLNYNRIFRIGHGLAACSTLKELYLAGNKISEVEGLHRLLKLNVLDLRFNKVSTVKSLGQLAANYGSLQAINLEGNPVQRNVGDDQLKRYLHSLLPRLIYFNKQIIRASSIKEVSDRPVRSATSRQYEHGTRSDHKHTRRGHAASSSHKVTSSSNHSRVGQAVSSLPKLPRRGQHANLPIPESKAYHLPRTSNKLFSSLQTINPIRRSRSEGHL